MNRFCLLENKSVLSNHLMKACSLIWRHRAFVFIILTYKKVDKGKNFVSLSCLLWQARVKCWWTWVQRDKRSKKFSKFWWKSSPKVVLSYFVSVSSIEIYCFVATSATNIQKYLDLSDHAVINSISDNESVVTTFNVTRFVPGTSTCY